MTLARGIFSRTRITERCLLWSHGYSSVSPQNVFFKLLILLVLIFLSLIPIICKRKAILSLYAQQILQVTINPLPHRMVDFTGKREINLVQQLTDWEPRSASSSRPRNQQLENIKKGKESWPVHSAQIRKTCETRDKILQYYKRQLDNRLAGWRDKRSDIQTEIETDMCYIIYHDLEHKQEVNRMRGHKVVKRP